MAILIWGVAYPVFAEQSNDAAKMAEAVEEAGDGKILCEVQNNARTIMCVANASVSDANQIASQIVFAAQIYDVDLFGWRLVLVTPDDYIIRRDF